MISITNPIEYLKSAITNYTAFLFIISSVGLFLFYSKKNSQEEFPKESIIAKFGAIGYISLGIGLIVIKLFL